MYSFFNFGARRGCQRRASAPLPPGKGVGTHCTGEQVGGRVGKDGCGNVCPHRDSILRSSSTWPVAIPTTLARPTINVYSRIQYAPFLQFQRAKNSNAD
jgi:hypothetical protein